MALPTITLVNLTGGDIVLEQLAVTVPASGTIDVTDFDTPGEVLNDDELQVEFDAGNLRINLTGGQLTSADTTKTLEQAKAIVQPIHDLDIRHNLAGTAAPVAGDDEDDGYAVGSIWVDTTNDTYYVCADATAAAAVWVANGGGSTVGEPQAGTNGNGLVFSVDPMDPSSMPIDQIATITELVSEATGTISNCTFTDGWLQYTNGSNSIVDMGAPSTDVVNAWSGGGTAAWWVNIDSLALFQTGWIIDGGWGTGSNNGYVFWISDVSGSTCRLNFSWHAGALRRWYVTVNIGEWFHVAVTMDTDDMTTAPVVYIDSVSATVTAVSTGGTYTPQTGDTNFGNRPALDRDFDGKIGPYELWDRTFSATEVLYAYNLKKVRYQTIDATWGSVLVAGQTSDGTDPVLSTSDTFRGPDAALNFTGSDFNIRGANSTSSVAQKVVITGGVSSASANHLGVEINGGTGSGFNGNGGPVVIRAGDGATGGGNAQGGDVTIITGDAASSSFAGDFTVTCGTAGTGTSGTGNITMTAGANPGTGLGNAGGSVTIRAGTSLGQTGGVTIATGNSLATVNSNNRIGNLVLQTGTMAGSATAWIGGNVTLESQGDTSGGTDLVTGGSVSISAGNTGATNQDGGDVNITAGNTYGFNGRLGGSITLTCGSENNGNASSLGGSVYMIPSTSTSGDDGQAFLQGTGSLAMLERAAAVPMTVVVPAAGYGRWWVRNDSPNVPMFTDDLGNDYVLNETGAGTLQEAYEGGNTITVSTAEGTLAISGTADDGQAVMTVAAGAHTGPTGGNLVAFTTDNNSLGDALFIDNYGTGDGLRVRDAGGFDNLSISGAGAVTILSSTGSDITMTSPLGDDIDINAGTNFTVDATLGSISLDATAASNFTTSSGDLTLSTATTTAAWDVLVTAGDSTNAATVGGNVSITAGSSGTTADGGAATVTGGQGGPTGQGGKANLIGGAGGSTSGTGGGAVVLAGTPTDGDGGPITIQATAGVGVNRNGGDINIDAGNSTGTQTGGEINITAGDGSSTSFGGATTIRGGDGRTGGDVNIISGDALTPADQSGNVRITASNGGAAPGQIFLETESDGTVGAPISLTTMSGFSGQDENHRTYGSSDLVQGGGLSVNQTVVTLVSLLNGENAKVDVKVTAVDNAVDSNLLSFRYEGDFYRSGGTVSSLGAYTNTSFSAGAANFTSNLSFNVGISGGNVLLRVTNTGATPADDFTINIACIIVTQIGGAAS